MSHLGYAGLMALPRYGEGAVSCLFYLAKRGTATSASRPSHAVGLMGPAVRNLLEQYAITKEKIEGTGPKGVILKGDVLHFIQSQKLKPAVIKVPLPVSSGNSATPAKTTVPSGKPGPKDSRGRIKYFDVPVPHDIKESSTAVVKGKTAVPHGYLYATCRVDEALKYFAENTKDKQPVTLTDVIVRAAASAAQKALSQLYSKEKYLDLGVQSFRNGKFETRLLKKANALRIKDISKQLMESGQMDSTKTSHLSQRVVSLVGSRLDQITEVLTPAQTWVLSVGDALTRIDAQTKAPSKIVTLAFTYNSAIISEYEASQFLDNVKNSVERPVFILLGIGGMRPQMDNNAVDTL
ncbi:pyruvate dehydrogenase protein X component, mitochondrial-like isoform X2 [Paramacrobiotus metropolitanus]|uniref:pyruvate dehydrogenase protein X component, mitochondrial-like isoform X2 n=1 Tax=Paramacrobiotus metropolitanus TaxID=2943436 RepID=UPI00244619FF|nr:pyruvate dehydrogenase protein X component, mitochondrial-like isoform X2 [Paramacrobiotus metropolitanus]